MDLHHVLGHDPGFHLPGELLGLDGLFGGAHQLKIVALVDSDLCSIAATEVQPLLADVPAIVQFFYQFLWKDVRRTRSFMTALSQRGAEQRVATFLVNFGKRLHHRGYSQSEFRLPMSRSDLGSYLMLQQETISRALTFLVERRYIELDNRTVKILQLDALRDFRGKRVN